MLSHAHTLGMQVFKRPYCRRKALQCAVGTTPSLCIETPNQQMSWAWPPITEFYNQHPRDPHIPLDNSPYSAFKKYVDS